MSTNIKTLSEITWTVIIGQSGSGKGMAAGLIKKWYQRSKIDFLDIGTGDLIRDTISTNTYLAQKIKPINDAGLRQPAIVAGSLWMNKLFSELKEGQRIIHEGSPRSLEELEMILAVHKAGYIDSLKIIEILSDDPQCYKRLWKRTEEDKRIDLSIEGKPGIPDPFKIRRKLSWWENIRPELIQSANDAGVYTSIANLTTPKTFERLLAEEFGFLELYEG